MIAEIHIRAATTKCNSGPRFKVEVFLVPRAFRNGLGLFLFLRLFLLFGKRLRRQEKPVKEEEKRSSEKGSAEKGSAEKGSAEKGSVEKGSVKKGSVEKGSTERGSAEKGADGKFKFEKEEHHNFR